MMMIIVMASPSGPSWPPTRGASIPKAHGNWRWVHPTHKTRFYWINIVVLYVARHASIRHKRVLAIWSNGLSCCMAPRRHLIAHSRPPHPTPSWPLLRRRTRTKRWSKQRERRAERGRGTRYIVHKAARILSLNVLAVFCLSEKKGLIDELTWVPQFL